MTREEAARVLRIMAEADGGCEVCARSLFSTFVELFPEYRTLGEEIFTEIFGSDLYVERGNVDEEVHIHHPDYIMYNFGEELTFMR